MSYSDSIGVNFISSLLVFIKKNHKSLPQGKWKWKQTANKNKNMDIY